MQETYILAHSLCLPVFRVQLCGCSNCFYHPKLTQQQYLSSVSWSVITLLNNSFWWMLVVWALLNIFHFAHVEATKLSILMLWMVSTGIKKCPIYCRDEDHCSKSRVDARRAAQATQCRKPSLLYMILNCLCCYSKQTLWVFFFFFFSFRGQSYGFISQKRDLAYTCGNRKTGQLMCDWKACEKMRGNHTQHPLTQEKMTSN